jgi:hypothetical protein
MLPVLINLESLSGVDEDATELCLGRMVREGTDTAPPTIEPDVLCQAYSVAQSTLAERFEARRSDVERLNQAFVDARLASVRESYRIKISRKQALLDSARTRDQTPQYIRMLEGTIRNLKAEQQRRETEIDDLRSVTAEHVLVATGILRVSVQ